MPEKSLSELLRAAAKASPYAFSDYYRRGRPIRRNPPPSPPQITFVITGKCALGCSFCFAGSATRRGIEVSPDRLRPVLEQCKGVPKAVLLGGEPFEHPGLVEIVKAAGAVFTDEIEIFTNGRMLPVDTGALDEILRSMEFGRKGPRIVLTLAADRFHLEKLGAQKLNGRVRQFLELKGRYGRYVRFNISDPAFQPEQYLARNVVTPVLRSISSELADYFAKLKNYSDIETGFYFNPILRQGGASPGACNTFPLRLSELARGGDMVIAPDLGDPVGKERLALFNSLNAAFASPPPGASVVGHMEGKGSLSLTDLCAKALSEGSRRPAVFRARRRTDEVVRALKLMHANPAAGWRNVAGRLLPVSRDTGELYLEAASWSEGVMLPLPALHALVRSLLSGDGAALKKGLLSFTAYFAALLGDGQRPRAPVLVSGWLDGMARIPAPEKIRISVGRACMDTGLGYWPAETAHPITPEVTISSGPKISWRLPGLQAARDGETDPGDLAVYTGFCRLLLGETAWRLARGEFLKLVKLKYPAGSEEKTLLARSIAGRDVPARLLLKEGSGDPLLLFRFFAYDPGRGGVAWDDRRLLETVLRGRWPNWEREKVKRLKAEMSARLQCL